MVEFTKEEQQLINQCRPFYKSKIMPDTPIKDIPIGDAL